MRKICLVTLVAGAALGCGGKHKDKGMATGSASGTPVASGAETGSAAGPVAPPETKPVMKEPPAPPPLPPKTPEEMAQRYQDCWGLFNAKKWDDFKGCYAKDAVSTQPGGGAPDVTGADAIVAEVQGEDAAFPDQAGALQLVLQNKTDTVGIAIFSGTNTGPMKSPQGDMPPTKKKFSLVFGHEIQFDKAGALAIKETSFGDMGTMLGQLGVVKGMPTRPLAKAWAKAPEVVIAKNDDAEEKTDDMVLSWIDSFNKHDLKAFGAVLSPKLVWSDQGEPKDLDMKGAIADTKSFWAGFSDVKIETDRVWPAGDYVVINGTMSGTNDGNLPAMHLKKTGKTFSSPFLQVVKVTDGKISRCWIFYQTIGLATQLGLGQSK
jgi:ketosteroid isomerase-like protein